MPTDAVQERLQPVAELSQGGNAFVQGGQLRYNNLSARRARTATADF